MTTKKELKELKRRIERMDKELGEARNTISFLLRNSNIKPVAYTAFGMGWERVLRVAYAYQGEYRHAEYPVYGAADYLVAVTKDGEENTLIYVVDKITDNGFTVILEKRSGNIIRLEDSSQKEGENE